MEDIIVISGLALVLAVDERFGLGETVMGSSQELAFANRQAPRVRVQKPTEILEFLEIVRDWQVGDVQQN